jgi:hypothetical protein
LFVLKNNITTSNDEWRNGCKKLILVSLEMPA